MGKAASGDNTIIRSENTAQSQPQPAFVHFMLFVALSSFCLLFRSDDPMLNWLLLMVPLFISIILLLSRSTVAIPVLFFTVIYIFRISFDLQLGLWLALPVALYVVLILLIPPWRKHALWLQWGKPNLRSWILAAITVLISSTALILWKRLAQPDLSKYTTMLQTEQLWFLVLTGLGFALLNALVEEAIFRGIMWEALGRLISPIGLILAIQAVVFGAMHLKGFPSGISGMALAAIYGALLGVVRHQSRGLGAPIITHFFADLTIFLIIFIPGF